MKLLVLEGDPKALVSFQRLCCGPGRWPVKGRRQASGLAQIKTADPTLVPLVKGRVASPLPGPVKL
jgi:hypothetical protein